MSAPALPDLVARRSAATDFRRNLVVEAGAGTGKTSLLVERALNALLLGVAQPRELAAITFTEKAAGEMLQRLADSLDQLLAALQAGAAPDSGREAGRVLAGPAGNLDRAVLEARALAALAQLDGMKITTIHGFCAELLRLHPRQAGVSPEFAVDSGERFERLFEEQWAAFLERELGPDAPRAEIWVRALATLRPAELRAAARALAGFQVPAALLRDAAHAPDAAGVLAPTATRLAAAARALLQEQEPLTPLQAQILASWGDALSLFARDGLPGLESWLQSHGEMAARLDSSSGLRGSKKQSSDFADRMVETEKACRGLLRELTRIDESMTVELITLLGPFALEMREAFLAAGLISYDGLLVLARDLLQHHPEVRRTLKHRFKALLVDEFQDTDPLQYDIVLLLAERPDEAAGDPWQARLDPGRLFIVGDPKQSIYRFRGADYAAFRRAVGRVLEEGGAHLLLTANFRSRPEVLDPVNRLFAGKGWEASDYQPRYVPVTGHRARVEDRPRVEIWTVPGRDDGSPLAASERRRAEGEAIAARIAALVEAGQARPSRITILLRAFTNLAAYLRPLRQHGIPFLVDGGHEFLQRSEIAHLVSLLRALVRPHDPVACVAFLRSPSAAVSDPDLARYAAAGGTWSWREMAAGDSAACPSMVRAARLLESLADRIDGLPADAAIAAVLRHSKVAALESATFEGAQRVANLRKLAAGAAGLARDGVLGLAEVLDLIEQTRPQELEGEAPLADEDTEAVRIMTIHRAKGLENDLIIVPDLARDRGHHVSGGPVAEPLRLDDGRITLALEIGRRRNAARVWARLETTHHERAEEARVLYVALTRARERLVVVAGSTARQAAWMSALQAWDYEWKSPPGDGAPLARGDVAHRILAPAAASATGRMTAAPDLDEGASAWQRAADRLRRDRGPQFATPSGQPEERGERLEDDSPPARGEPGAAAGRGEAEAATGRAVGIALHLLLERFSGDPTELAAGLPRCVARAAAETGLTEREVAAAAGPVARTLAASPLPGRFRELEILGREVPVLLAAGDGRLWRGSIDLLARRGDGSLLVIDYKSDQDEDPGRLADRHAAQLAVYAEAARRAFGLDSPPAVELWLLRSGRALPLDVAAAAARLMLAPAGG